MAVWYGGGGGIVDDLLLKYGADPPTPGGNDVKYVTNLLRTYYCYCCIVNCSSVCTVFLYIASTGR